MSLELVDVLSPPDFEPNGVVKPVLQAIVDGDWLGVINLWVVRPGPALLYQQRPRRGWEPGKLDGSVGGYYRAGEQGLDGLREATEELGCIFDPRGIERLGRHLSVGIDDRGRRRHLVVSVFMTYDDLPLSRLVLDPEEVPAIYEMPTRDVIGAFENPEREFIAYGITSDGHMVERQVSAHDFSYVFGGYHLKIAKIAELYASGQRGLYY